MSYYEKADIEVERASVPMVLTATDGKHIHLETGEGPNGGFIRDIFNYTPKGHRTPVKVSIHFHQWDNGEWRGCSEDEIIPGNSLAELRNAYISKNALSAGDVSYDTKQKVYDDLRPIVEKWAASDDGRNALFRAALKDAERTYAACLTKVEEAEAAQKVAQKEAREARMALNKLTKAE